MANEMLIQPSQVGRTGRRAAPPAFAIGSAPKSAGLGLPPVMSFPTELQTTGSRYDTEEYNGNGDRAAMFPIRGRRTSGFRQEWS